MNTVITNVLRHEIYCHRKTWDDWALLDGLNVRRTLNPYMTEEELEEALDSYLKDSKINLHFSMEFFHAPDMDGEDYIYKVIVEFEDDYRYINSFEWEL